MSRYFDNNLPQINADKIKPMVKMWGGTSTKMTKYDCIDFILASLKDPQKVQSAVANLQPWERNALALVKRMGGVVSNKALMTGILISGLAPNHMANQKLRDWSNTLLKRGLVLPLDERSDFSYYDHEALVYSDDRLLAQVGFPECQLFKIQSQPLPGETHLRRPNAVALDVMGILQTIENLGGIKINQNGSLKVNDLTKFSRAMRWDQDRLEMDGFIFPDPVDAWLEAFSISDLVKKTQAGQLVLSETPAQFAQRPFGEQVRMLMEGLIRTETWQEMKSAPNRSTGSRETRHQGRLALTQALSALPLNPDGFFRIESFEQALFARIGYQFSLSYIPTFSTYYQDTPAEKQRKLAEWQANIRANWLKQEVPWLIAAFTTWLYFLGLVELVMDQSRLIGFRLTEIGRATFHPELDSVEQAEPAPETSSQPAWVVQPNFDIIAYLDRVSAPQLAFLERHAQRTESQRHTAHYRITRESVYGGLESGSSLENLIKNLQAGAQTPLPQNVIVELHEWAGQRERMILHRHARLIEFSSGQALQAQLAQGLKGHIVAERFLLLDSAPLTQGWNKINYSETLPKNLAITETGRISWKNSPKDLMTAAQLTQWAQPLADGNWQITRESVSAAIKPGKKLAELLSLLNNRLVPNQPASNYMPPVPSIPPLLELALRSWAGAKYAVELEETIVLRCPQEQIFQALITSALIKPLLKGYLYPNLLFVHTEHFETLNQHLIWLGWQISDHLQVI
jgi:hypothetical protein